MSLSIMNILAQSILNRFITQMKCGMLNMWTNMTALHMQCIYFEFVRHVYLSELNTLNHPLSPDKYTCLTNSKYLHCMCGAVIFVHIFNIPHFICVTDL